MIGPAPIYSLTEDATRAESAAWARFSAAKDSAEFCTSWLAILCMQIERVGGALLLLGPDAKAAGRQDGEPQGSRRAKRPVLGA